MKHRVLVILIVSIQVLRLVTADFLDKHVDDYDPDVDDPDVIDDEIQGIKQSKHDVHERLQNVMHGSDIQSPTTQSQHIKSSHSGKFAGQDQTGDQLKEAGRSSAPQTATDPGKSSDALNKQPISESLEEVKHTKESKHVVDEKLLFEEAELEEETLTEQVLRLGKKLKAELGKVEEAVATGMEQMQDKVEEKLDTLKEDVSNILETKTSVKLGMGRGAKSNDQKTDTVKEINEPALNIKEEQTENEKSKAEGSTISQQKHHEKESVEEESVTDNIKKLGQKVLDSEKITEGFEEHDDLNFPNDPDDIVAEDEDGDDEILYFTPLEEADKDSDSDKFPGTMPDSNTKQPVEVEPLKDISSENDKMKAQKQNAKAKTENLIFEESGSEDGSLIDEVIKLSEKLKAEVDRKVTADTDKLNQKTEEFDLIDKDVKHIKTDFPEKPGGKLSYKHVSQEKTKKTEEKNDKQEISTEQINTFKNKILDNSQNTHKDENMQSLESVKSVDTDGKSSVLSDGTPAKVENTAPPEVNIEPSETQRIDTSKKVNSYSKLSADETNIRATPTSKIIEQSPDNIIHSPNLHMTPSQTVEYPKSVESSAVDSSKPKAKEELSSNIRRDEKGSIVANTELFGSPSGIKRNEREKTDTIVSKTESLVQHSTSEFKIQELHSATPSDNIVSSEAIFQSEHTVTAHAEETRKDKRDQPYKLEPAGVEKAKVMETAPNGQTATVHTQLRQEGKRKIVGDICWDFAHTSFCHPTLFCVLSNTCIIHLHVKLTQ